MAEDLRSEAPNAASNGGHEGGVRDGTANSSEESRGFSQETSDESISVSTRNRATGLNEIGRGRKKSRPIGYGAEIDLATGGMDRGIDRRTDPGIDDATGLGIGGGTGLGIGGGQVSGSGEGQVSGPGRDRDSDRRDRKSPDGENRPKAAEGAPESQTPVKLSGGSIVSEALNKLQMQLRAEMNNSPALAKAKISAKRLYIGNLPVGLPVSSNVLGRNEH
ncbi:hypothetical protein GUITHDRAFT_109099 [Guillardia theta CCMP2712]|uniref:Uncharacterized protein n=1 Tax=Guillardia theta (strain CCMP2712) TaxID=905079 RepID=L1JAD6_GUITC|nr:hypothetical protein GUITHDRAFT_109099 [Guillardia theta CCMP2712]EKX45055.1 hypothetical protein GUITHDRAFT_109099 [Guillardia theta CCMP2712]|eukprot:XP_005832035.1 hypothetical protein GUITHDRAFT_109099 [Guillardia theta CCMP2712]